MEADRTYILKLLKIRPTLSPRDTTRTIHEPLTFLRLRFRRQWHSRFHREPMVVQGALTMAEVLMVAQVVPELVLAQVERRPLAATHWFWTSMVTASKLPARVTPQSFCSITMPMVSRPEQAGSSRMMAGWC